MPKKCQYISFTKLIVRRIIYVIDELNGVIKTYSVAALHCSSKAGVAILFNNNFSFQISRTYTDPEGRFIICALNTNGKFITLVNIYAPNEDDPNYFTSVFNQLLGFKCDEIIIGGDYNLVLEVEKDKKGGIARTHKKSLEVIHDYS